MARIEIRRILCPTDFSPFAERAFQYAVALARWYEARLSVLHVQPPPTPGRLHAYAGAVKADTVAESHLLQDLTRFTRPAEEAGIPTEMHLREGHVSRTILDLARALPTDLVVMGTHGREGFERLVLGSVTEKVLRKAYCPVLTVPPAVEAEPVASEAVFRRILCAVDFSDASQQAFEYALSLAQEAKAALELLHVVVWGTEESSLEGGLVGVPEFRRHLEADARSRLKNMVSPEVRQWCAVEESLGTGKAWQGILERSAKGGADLIVMGVRGRGTVDLALFGSTTNHVVRAAQCPVLTVREAVAAASGASVVA